MIHFIFGFSKQPPHQRLCAESLQQSGSHILALHALRGLPVLFGPEIHGVVDKTANGIKRVSLFLQANRSGTETPLGWSGCPGGMLKSVPAGPRRERAAGAKGWRSSA